MSDKEKSDIKFLEKFSIKFRKKIITSRLLTLLIVLALICAFIGLNYWVKKLDLPEIDVTSNKIYTLSDESKQALQGLDQNIKIYVFGIDEDSSVVGLIKQYCDANSERISYEMLSNESNMEKVQEFDLQDGYSIVIIESGQSRKLIDASTEFSSYDYVTYQSVDTTEQVLTNSILSLSTENKPKVYFVQGHNEYSLKTDGSKSELGVLSTYLINEAYEVSTIDLMTTGAVPEDCDVLAIMSPSTDFMENEAQAVIDYINKGGNLLITRDVLNKDSQLTNFQKILDLYGVSIENGYAVEKDINSAVASYPFIFKPVVSETSKITSSIFSDSYLVLAYAEKLNFLPEEQLNALNVTYEELISTSDLAVYVTNLAADLQSALSGAQSGKILIAAEVTKTISEADTENPVQSKLIISGTGSFMTDYVVSQLDQQLPISYKGSNKDFGINAISELADKKNSLTIRKEMSGTSYSFTATVKQNAIVLAIIFVIPVLIILLGIIIWRLRRRRK